MSSTNQMLNAMGSKSKVDKGSELPVDVLSHENEARPNPSLAPSPSMADVLQNCLKPKNTAENTPLK